MLNTKLLANKYKSLIQKNKKDFITELSFIKENINFNKLLDKPILCYSQNRRNALYYLLAYYFSLKRNKVLTYVVITGQSFIDQHFMNEKKDNELLAKVNYSDILFISLSEFDYTNQYLEALLINLVQSRTDKNLITIISYDVLNSGKSSYLSYTKNLNAYFVSNKFQIIDIVSKSLAESFSLSQSTDKKNSAPINRRDF